MKTKHNNLSSIKIGQLYKWLDENKQNLPRLSSVLLAEEATKALGFTISKNSVRSLRKEMGFGPGIGGAQRPAASNAAKAKTAFFCACLIDLYKSLDKHVPSRLYDILESIKDKGDLAESNGSN